MKLKRPPATLFALGLLAAAAGAAAIETVDAGGLRLLAPPDLQTPDGGVGDLNPGNRRAFQLTPSFELASTLTDNRALAAENRQSDAVTRFSPGLRLDGNGNRVQGHLDYTLNAYVFARDSGDNTLQNALSAALSIEAVEDRAFIDIAASVGQQEISAFGQLSPGGSLGVANSNSSEVATYSLSPYLRGRLGGYADYEARLTHEATRVSDSAASDSSTTTGLLRLAQDRAFGRLGWALEARRERVDFQAGRATTDERARVVLTYFVLPELRLAASAGRESNDYAGGERESGNTAGLGLVWKPGERTSLVAERETRLVGSAHTLSFEHRMPRSVWRLSDTRDASSSFGQRGIGGQGNTYDLLYTQFASREPDPVRRAQLVREFLQSSGLDAATGLPGGALPSALTDERQQALSFAWLGLRDTLAFSATRNTARRLDTASTAVDDFSGELRQQGLSAELSHRLSESAALNLSAAQLQTRGDSAGQASRLRSFNLIWSGALDRRLGYALGLRHVRFASDTAPYTESALTASLSLSF